MHPCEFPYVWLACYAYDEAFDGSSRLKCFHIFGGEVPASNLTIHECYKAIMFYWEYPEKATSLFLYFRW